MGLNEIKTLNELLQFMPLLVKLKKDLDGYWAYNLNSSEFVAELTNRFQKDSFYYGLKYGDELYYFIAVDRVKPTKAIFWLFYMNKNKREHTRNLLNTLKSEFARMGCKKAEFTTTRMTRSYDRWVSSFGATKTSLTYSLNLN